MKNMIKLLIGCAAVAGMALPASADITLSLTPTSQSSGLGIVTSYDLTISGLKGSADYNGPALGGFSTVLDFDSSIASVASVSFGSSLNLSGGDLQLFDSSTSGQLYLSEFSFDSAAALEQAQSSSFTLATISFEGAGLGTTALTFDLTQTSLTDENANTLKLIRANGSSLSVAAVPEPGIYALAGFGAFVAMLRRGRVSAGQFNR
jgi:hypothetical protein